MTTEAPAAQETFELAFCTVCQQAYAYVDSRTWSPCHGDDATERFNLGLFLDLVQSLTETVLPFFSALATGSGLSLAAAAEKLAELLKVSAPGGQERPPHEGRGVPPTDAPASAKALRHAAASPGQSAGRAASPGGRTMRSNSPAGLTERAGASHPDRPPGEKTEAT